MPRKLLVLTVIALFSLPTYAAGQCCCCQSEKKQTQAQNSDSKNQAGCPAVATGAAPSSMTPETSQQKLQDQMLSQKAAKSEKDKN
jgi:hypothetical protein